MTKFPLEAEASRVSGFQFANLLHFNEVNRDELYHLEKDSAEQIVRAKSEVKISKQLRRKLDDALEGSGALCRFRTLIIYLGLIL